ASKIELGDVDFLWKELQDGDRSGLEGLYRHFAKALFRYGLSMVPDQDFVQECNIQKNHQNLGLQSTSKQWLKDAADAAQEIIDSNHYSLHSTGNPDRDYGTLFVSENPVSWEIMWANL